MLRIPKYLKSLRPSSLHNVLRLPLRALLLHALAARHIAKRLFDLAHRLAFADLTALLVGDLLGCSHFFYRCTLV